MTPPEKLRTELERMRDRGHRFRSAWPAAANEALRGENAHAAIFWRATFAEQRPIWAVSYSRTPWPVNRRPALAPFDQDRSGPARPTAAAPVLA